MGDLSAHFDSSEFRCKCPRWHSRQPLPPTELVAVLERIRLGRGRPLSVLSGYRCSAHNREVGGAPNSLHLSGRACDLEVGYATVAAALRAGARGVGHRRGWAVHVDVRSGPVVTFAD